MAESSVSQAPPKAVYVRLYKFDDDGFFGASR